MLERVVTRSGQVVYIRTTPVFGRHEIATIEFDKWDRKRAHYIDTVRGGEERGK